MLAAVIYVSKDGILNDNKYDYEKIGWPFTYQLGQAIYQHELTRKRIRRPNLDRFKVTYEHATSTIKGRSSGMRIIEEGLMYSPRRHTPTQCS